MLVLGYFLPSRPKRMVERVQKRPRQTLVIREASHPVRASADKAGGYTWGMSGCGSVTVNALQLHLFKIGIPPSIDTFLIIFA